ncbi:hypothetical protein DFA_11346 [Cavenderia fasciculata]|uniref:Uncharacterized protein n=1 Tax=Cavenderia fasciculata TaxID=261658 RepID=F4QCF0_CACFS|nr:uncharacterized protein DFA_11346 [Cavenderia fasciculata]EGG13585.1 hypothetical protein DFA_11346 [Cavenderia fasciculata]|eukprot:XP_004350289.1 hypothetical protein DFA_11346 [Cavenderia fasciculata]
MSVRGINSYHISSPGIHAITTFRYDSERELRRLERRKLVDKCKQLKVQTTYSSSDGEMINSILLAQGYTLPWPIVQSILTYASQYNSLCTCVNRDELKRTYQTRSRPKYCDQDDHQHQMVLHTNMMTHGDMKQHSLTRDQLCPLHQFNLDQGYEPNFVLGSPPPPLYKVSRESCRWMRSMALLSKRIFAFISTTLFTNIVMDPTADTWSHITNNYCIIKQPKILTLVSPSSDTQLFFTNKSQSSSSIQFLKNVEKIYIKGTHLVEKVATIRSLINLTPSLTSLTVKCEIEQSVIIDLLNYPTKSMTSINFGNAEVHHSRGERPFKSDCLIQNLTKIILPFSFDWNSLSKDIKHNLQVISLMYSRTFHTQPIQDNIKLSAIDFPNLRHVHTKDNSGKAPNIPEHIDKVTYLEEVSKDVINLLSMFNISTLRVRSIYVRYLTDYNKISSLKKIVIFSKTDICATEINHFNSIGFDFIGSMAKSNQRKLIFIKNGETNHNNPITLNNNNNSPQLPIKTTTTISSNNNNNIILPNIIINKIIKMTWKLRERCTCVYEKETIQKWINIGYDILKDEQELDRFNQIKNNCPTHFSNTQPYQPLTYDLKSSNRSKLQLALINKDIFDYISNNCFSIINLEHCDKKYITKHTKNPYCVALKHLTTIKCNTDHDMNIDNIYTNIQDNFPNITKLVLFNIDRFQDIIKLVPNLTSIDITKHIGVGLDITNLHQLKNLTKLDIWTQRIRKGSFLDEIKDMSIKKLCLPINYFDQLHQLPLGLRQSVTKITAAPILDLDDFPNLNHVVINGWPDSNPLKLPNTVTKVTSYKYQIDFVVHNKSVKKLKVVVPILNRGPFELLLKTLSSPQCSPVQTFIYGCHGSFQIPSYLFNDFNYRIEYSRTSLDDNMAQYLKLSRIDQSQVAFSNKKADHNKCNTM